MSRKKDVIQKIFNDTAYSVAKKLNLKVTQLYKWNNGVTRFDVEMLKKLAKLKKVTPGQFVDLYLKEIVKTPVRKL